MTVLIFGGQCSVGCRPHPLEETSVNLKRIVAKRVKSLHFVLTVNASLFILCIYVIVPCLNSCSYVERRFRCDGTLICSNVKKSFVSRLCRQGAQPLMSLIKTS